MFPEKKEKIVFAVGAFVILAVLFSIYATYNQRYVGACDWYGYYQQAQLLKQGKVYMETALPASIYPSIAPLSYFEKDGKVVPQYPTGFPILMAIAGFAGLEFYVNPIIGVLSVILMFLIINMMTDKWTAGLFAMLWGFFPIVVWGSTNMMSDLSATFFILLAFYLFKIKKIIPSAFALAFSVAIRPTDALFCVVILSLAFFELKEKKQWLKYALWFIAFASIYGFYNWQVYGFPWKTGYLDISYDLSVSIFYSHLLFYLKEIMLQFTPILFILAIVGLWKKEKNSIFFFSWFLVFFIFYCFWRPGGDIWWWTRFLLPAFPALFILAALGFKRVITAIRSNNKILKNALITSVALIAVLVNGYFIYRGNNYSELWAKGKASLFYEISVKVSKNIEPGGMVGALDFSGALRLYGGIESFNTIHINSVFLISDMIKKGIPVYIIVEPWYRDSFVMTKIFDNFACEKTVELGGWVDFYLYKIVMQKDKELHL